MLIKFLITTSIVFNSLTSLAVDLNSSFNDFPELKFNKIVKEKVEKTPLSPDWQFQKAAILAIEQALPNFLPIRNWGIDNPEIEARASLILDLEKDKILYQENIDKVLPIASLTKLTTALVVLENIDQNEVVQISERAIAGYGERGGLFLDEEITVRNLLHALLMESSNDAAHALAEAVEKETGRDFIELMNEKVKGLGLKETKFIDPSGYSPENVSNVYELSQIVKASFKEPLIWEIMKTPMIELFSTDRKIRHYWINTDKLLSRLNNVIGGKTGYTEEAKGCLILVVQEDNGPLISVVLGADERFLETERLINWVKKAYQW